jgi:hypothetical protein
MTLCQTLFELHLTQVILQIFITSRAINLTQQNKSKSKTQGKQFHMLINNPVKFHDSRSNTFWVTCDTIWKLYIFIKSRPITLKILNISTRKCPGAQLHMLIIIPVRFHDSRSNSFWATCDTKWERTDGRTDVLKGQ